MNVDMERQDLERLGSSLTRMLRGEVRYGTLNPEGDRLRLLFELEPTGHVRVDIEMSDTMFVSRIKLRSVSDQTICVAFVSELTLLLDRFPKTR